MDPPRKLNKNAPLHFYFHLSILTFPFPKAELSLNRNHVQTLCNALGGGSIGKKIYIQLGFRSIIFCSLIPNHTTRCMLAFLLNIRGDGKFAIVQFLMVNHFHEKKNTGMGQNTVFFRIIMESSGQSYRKKWRINIKLMFFLTILIQLHSRSILLN